MAEVIQWIQTPSGILHWANGELIGFGVMIVILAVGFVYSAVKKIEFF